MREEIQLVPETHAESTIVPVDRIADRVDNRSTEAPSRAQVRAVSVRFVSHFCDACEATCSLLAAFPFFATDRATK